MPYREDGDALLARNDALEREAEELRREVQRLREAAPVPVVAVAPSVVAAPPTVASSPRALLASLQSTAPRAEILAVVVTLGGVAIVWAALTFGGAAAGFAAGAVLWVCWSVMHEGAGSNIAAEQAWIDRRPFGLDPARYRALLSEHHARRRVIARIGFVRFVPPALRPSVANRLGVVSRWEGDQLVIESPTFDTMRVVNGTRTCESSQVHRWVRTLVARMEKLDLPIASLAIESV